MRVTAFLGTDPTTTDSHEPGADGARPGRRLTRRRVGTWLAVGACVLAALAWVGGVPTREYTVEIGLSSLPANAGHGDVKQPSPRAIAMPINGWVRGMSVELVDAQGREVPQRVLHHLNVIMPERRELFSQIMLRIGAAGEQGYFVGDGTAKDPKGPGAQHLNPYQEPK
jgi:hypothetical protein